MNLYVLISACSKYTSKETRNNNGFGVAVQSQSPERETEGSEGKNPDCKFLGKVQVRQGESG